MEDILSAAKVTMILPVSGEQFADTQEFGSAMWRHLRATDEERAATAAEALARRAAERAAAQRTRLTLDALMDRAGWPREYAEHFVQPYCECGDGMDGWDYCQHARDEGLSR